MGDGEVWLVEEKIVVVDDVDVEGARAPVDEALTALRGFDGVDGLEKLLRREQGFDENGAVQEWILVGVAPGRGFDPVGGFEQANVGLRCEGLAGLVELCGAVTDVAAEGENGWCPAAGDADGWIGEGESDGGGWLFHGEAEAAHERIFAQKRAGAVFCCGFE